eukprot:2995335-Pleurochrysis_carterae.AAC.1
MATSKRTGEAKPKVEMRRFVLVEVEGASHFVQFDHVSCGGGAVAQNLTLQQCFEKCKTAAASRSPGSAHSA